MRSYTAADNSQTIRQCTTKIDALFNEILPVVMHDGKTDQNHLGAEGRAVLLRILQGGVLAGSPNPDPISDQKLAFSTPIFRPDILSPYPFSDLAFRQKVHHNYIIILECDKKIRTSNAF